MGKPGRKPQRPKIEEVVEKVDPAVLLKPTGPLYSDAERYQMVQRLLDLSLRSLVQRFEDNPTDMSAAERGEAQKLIATFERFFAQDVKASIAQQQTQKQIMEGLPTFSNENTDDDDEDLIINPRDERYLAPFEGKKDDSANKEEPR